MKAHYLSPSLLRAQLSWLLSRRYEVVSLGEVLGFVRGAPRQGNWAAITFDDGYASVHEYALPALREAAATATVFVVAGSVDGWNEWDQAEGDVPEPILSQAQIAELRAAGVEIGSHGMTHAHLTRLPDARAWTEIADSKSSLEDMMQAPVDFFAYPYGEGDDRIRDMVARAGYRAACSTVGRACMPGDDPFSLPRVNIRRYNYLPMFARKLKRACRAASP